MIMILWLAARYNDRAEVRQSPRIRAVSADINSTTAKPKNGFPFFDLTSLTITKITLNKLALENLFPGLSSLVWSTLSGGWGSAQNSLDEMLDGSKDKEAEDAIEGP